MSTKGKVSKLYCHVNDCSFHSNNLNVKGHIKTINYYIKLTKLISSIKFPRASMKSAELILYAI